MDGFALYAASRCEVGEGSLWHEQEGMLYWIDVSRGDVYRRRPEAAVDDFERYQLGLGKIGGMVLTRDGSLLLFAAQGKVWRWRPGKTPVLQTELPAAADTRFNDVIADPAGRVYCGVAPVAPGGNGSLWRMEADGSFVCLEPVTAGMPNGMGFSPDLCHFYFTVTPERTIYRYGYDRTTGALSDRTALIKVSAEEGFPDGMTVDADGCIWSAQWNGSRLVRYSAAGEKLQEFRFAPVKVSCVTFGGKDHTEMFVTTANHPWNDGDFENGCAGAVFRWQSPFRGRPEFIV